MGKKKKLIIFKKIQRVLFLADFLLGAIIGIPDNVGNEQPLIITVTRNMQKRSKEVFSQVSHSYVLEKHKVLKSSSFE